MTTKIGGRKSEVRGQRLQGKNKTRGFVGDSRISRRISTGKRQQCPSPPDQLSMHLSICFDVVKNAGHTSNFRLLVMFMKTVVLYQKMGKK